MKHSAVPHAKVGDLCIMLVQSYKSPRPDWQLRLQTLFGGICSTGLHITCQRLTLNETTPLEPLLDDVRRVSAMLTPFSISGEELQVWYSDIRACAIIKCMVTPGPLFERYVAGLNALCDQHGVQRHYHGSQIYTRIPVTVIEQVSRETTFAPEHHAFVQQPLFTVTDVLVSRITGSNQFERVARWEILSALNYA